MRQRANEGGRTVIWFIIGTVLVLFILGAVFWWYDYEVLHH
ncbi:hypothetical protein [Alicyclobacillus cycloheptanicus]|uniref:Uncharacterized protein n=1 Tax=Alicyclobacillus cycloheptanicus TaxID=1457 RepID=A0ABT9XEB5_9BACL|nr:hypothetical protein [Alicyclobacillus cycloheptanicus]MDQ0188625.1 hypothetical protein [Alicyclobacillus cycloheptanicus]